MVNIELGKRAARGSSRRWSAFHVHASRLTYQLVLIVVDLVLVSTRSDAQLRAEVLPSAIISASSSARAASLPGSQVTAPCLVASAQAMLSNPEAQRHMKASVEFARAEPLLYRVASVHR